MEKSVIWRRGEKKGKETRRRREKMRHVCIVAPVNFKAYLVAFCMFVPFLLFSSFPRISRRKRERKRERDKKENENENARHLVRRTQEIGIIPRRKSIPRRNYCVASAIFHENTPGGMYEQRVCPHTTRNDRVRENFLAVELTRHTSKKIPEGRLQVFIYSPRTFHVLFKNCFPLTFHARKIVIIWARQRNSSFKTWQFFTI